MPEIVEEVYMSAESVVLLSQGQSAEVVPKGTYENFMLRINHQWIDFKLSSKEPQTEKDILIPNGDVQPDQVILSCFISPESLQLYFDGEACVVLATDMGGEDFYHVEVCLASSIIDKVVCPGSITLQKKPLVVCDSDD